jgi:hypothetical protein
MPLMSDWRQKIVTQSDDIKFTNSITKDSLEDDNNNNNSATSFN